MSNNQVSIIMGSKSDWPVMEHCANILKSMNVSCEARVLSAHRTPEALFSYLKEAEERGTQIFIAAAGGAAHLPGVVASKTVLPVIGVPILSQAFNGLDSLLSIVQMPGGIPVATMAVGKPGAINAALLAVSILGVAKPEYKTAIENFRAHQAQAILENVDPQG